MFLITIAAIFAVAQTIAFRQEKKLADTLGPVCMGFILVLYILAFFKILPWIDYISMPVLLGCLFSLWRDGQLRSTAKNALTLQNLCIVITLLLLTWSQKDRVAVWWDDINYWATDAKALWALGGFAGKYGNVAPDFGDYPPAIQLFKWFFLHMSPHKFKEGLGFAGYMCLNFILILPLMARLDELFVSRFAERFDDGNVGVKVAKNAKYHVDDRRLISKYKVKIQDSNALAKAVGEQMSWQRIVLETAFNVIACLCLVLFPTVANIVCFEGTCVDVTMGLVYGMLLWGVWDKDMAHRTFYYIRIGLYGSVLVLCKSVGMEWAVFAGIFMLIVYRTRKRGERFNTASIYETDIYHALFAMLSWVISIGSWMGFCLINRRVASLTNDGVQMVKAKNVQLAYFAKEKSLAFLEGFALYPMHTDKTWLLDLPVLAMIVIFIAAVIFMGKKEVITKGVKRQLLFFIVFTALVAYGIIYIGHLTIFAAETQYSTGQVMAISISRYGSPFVLGTMLLIMGIGLNSVERFDGGRPVTDKVVRGQMQTGTLKSLRFVYILYAVFILVTCDWVGVYNGLTGYRENVSKALADRKAMIDTKEQVFLDALQYEELVAKRVLYLKDANDLRWVHNAYINYEAAPIAVVYNKISADTGADEMSRILTSSHALFVYAEPVDGTLETLKDLCDDEFEFGRLYRIKPDGRLELYYETADK